jgi:hypothetical protein
MKILKSRNLTLRPRRRQHRLPDARAEFASLHHNGIPLRLHADEEWSIRRFR